MTDKKQQIASMPPQERKVVLERANSRDIVQTILQYGVSQQQIVYILSLELENMQLVQKISELIDSTLDDNTDSLNEEKATKPKAKIYT